MKSLEEIYKETVNEATNKKPYIVLRYSKKSRNYVPDIVRLVGDTQAVKYGEIRKKLKEDDPTSEGNYKLVSILSIPDSISGKSYGDVNRTVQSDVDKKTGKFPKDYKILFKF